MSVNPLDIPEILQWILNCRQILDQEDLFSASLVNKAWYQVSKRAQWIKLELDSDSWVDPYHQALAAQLSMYGAFVRTLVLKECVADRSQLEAILPYMTCLQSIMVGRVTLYNRSSSLLQSLELLPMAHLQHLCLPHVSTASGRIDLLLRICESQAHQIMHLELLDSEIDDDVLADIARTCPSLKTLDLSRNEVIAFKGALDSSESDTTDDTQQNWTAMAAALLQEDPPFMHLEELSLVFCFGIANTEFQTLFRSFRNKSLRSLNLQFTNIEDSGLEALAQNIGHRLTSVSVSYCNRITARGIRALVEPNRCPRLLELEFLSCDLVSADCFRDPWGCHRLRRLEFTFHPRIAMKRMEIERAAAAAEAEAEEQFLQQQQHQDQQQQQMGQNASMDPLLDDGTDNFGLVLPHAQDQSQQGQAQLEHHLDHQQQQHHLEQQHLEQQQQHHQTPTLTNKQDNQALLLDSGVLLEESSQVREQYRDGLWLEEQESVRNDYYALFKQLKRPTAPRYLSIYNSPALNNNNNSTHSSDSSSQGSADEPESTLPLDEPTPASPSQENWSESAEEEDGSSSSDSGRYGRRRESIASGSGQGEDEETDHIVPDDKSTKAAGVAEPSEMYQKSTETATRLNSELESVHPFSLRMGLKALERLTNLESLTFYERSSVTIGEAEVRWIGKHFTHLLTLQLRGSIDVSEKASKQLASRRPDIKLQVCSLFE
ncbi:hypothetical protein BGZ90_010081 [Linnemannia elongata]|nr:hypothetical protein BGZ90_010081 [Linnemannia elongata]